MNPADERIEHGRGPSQVSGQSPARVWLAFAAVIVAWGSSYLFIRLAIESFRPFGLVATRFCIASLLCAGIAVLRKETFPKGVELRRNALLGVMLMSGSNALTAFAQATVASGITAVVHSLSAVWLAALGKERLARTVWLGVIGGVAGVAVLLWPGKTRVDLLGAGALVTAGWIFTFATLLQRRWSVQPAHGGMFAGLSVQMMTGGLVSTAITLAGPGYLHAPMTLAAFAGLAWLTVVSSLGGFAGYAIVLKHWPTARAGSFAVLTPVVSVLLGVTLLEEPFTVRAAAGVGITLASVAWVQTRMERASRLPQNHEGGTRS